MPQLGHAGNLLDGRKVSSDCNGLLSYGKRQALVPRQFDEKSTCPKKRPGPFMRHGHDTPREDMPKSSLPASCLTDRESRGIPGVRIARTTIYLIAAPVPIKAELHVGRVGGESDHAGIWLSRPVAWPLAPPPGIKPRAPAFPRCKLMRKRTPPAQPYARIARKLMPRALAGKPVAAWRHAQAYAQQDTCLSHSA